MDSIACYKAKKHSDSTKVILHKANRHEVVKRCRRVVGIGLSTRFWCC
jgi:ribosomal protein L7/L12